MALLLRSAIFALAALSAGGPAAQTAAPQTALSDQGRPIVIGRSYEVCSRVLGDVRRINVRLPDHYGEPGRRFPVLFLLDGGEREDFLHVAGLTQIIAAYGAAREMIVVGIEGVDRRHDLTSPSSVPADRKVAPTSGGSAAYRRFLLGELKPWVAARFATDDRTAIMGESLAGLFVLETLFAEPAAFDDYIAVSPSLWWNGGDLSGRAASELRPPRFSGRRLWVAFDAPAPPADQAARERTLQARLEGALRASGASGLRSTVVHSREGHGSIFHPAAFEALRTLYAIDPAKR